MGGRTGAGGLVNRILAYIRKKREQYRLARNQRLFVRLYNDPKSGIHEIVNAAAQRLGMGMAMGQLDQLGYQHCSFCPQTKPLRVVEGTSMRACNFHYPIAYEKHRADLKKEAEQHGKSKVG